MFSALIKFTEGRNESIFLMEMPNGVHDAACSQKPLRDAFDSFRISYIASCLSCREGTVWDMGSSAGGQLAMNALKHSALRRAVYSEKQLSIYTSGPNLRAVAELWCWQQQKV